MVVDTGTDRTKLEFNAAAGGTGDVSKSSAGYS